MDITDSKSISTPFILPFFQGQRRTQKHARLVSNFWHRTILANTFAQSIGERRREGVHFFPSLPERAKTAARRRRESPNKRYPGAPLLAHNTHGTPPKDIKGITRMAEIHPWLCVASICFRTIRSTKCIILCRSYLQSQEEIIEVVM